MKGLKSPERRLRTEELTPKIDAILGAKTREEWMKTLLEADVPVTPVQDRDQVVRDPQVLTRGMILEIVFDSERLKQVRFSIKLSATPASLNLPHPSLGEHTEEVLKDVGFDLDSIRARKRTRVI